MALLDGVPLIETVEAHRPWPRAIVENDGWLRVIDRLVAGHCTLLGLWGDVTDVHMALLDERAKEIAVVSYATQDGTYPSVAVRHAPALRLERAIRDLFGLEAIGAPDRRPWLDLGFWETRYPLGKTETASQSAPYVF